MKAPAKNPCGSCPYRRDVPSGVWHEEEYERLPAYDNDTPDQPTRVFGCHQNNGHLCSGWVGCHDMGQNLGLRLSAAFGHMTPEDLDATHAYVSPVPLFGTGKEAAEHGLSGVKDPDERAIKTIEKLQHKKNRTNI